MEEAVDDNSSKYSLVHTCVDRMEHMVLQVEQHCNKMVNRLEHTILDS